MKILVTETIQRTYEIDVPGVTDEQGAISVALAVTAEIQPADWEYERWIPLTREGRVITPE